MTRAILIAPALVLILLAGIYLLTPQVPMDISVPRGGYLDVHANLACVGAGDSGCFVNKSLVDSYKLRLYLHGFGVTEDELKAQGDELMARRMNKLIAESRYIHGAVLLAWDGVVRNDQIDTEATQIYVPDEFVSRMAGKFPYLEYGASVHPERSDWRERLVRARQDGAVLVKWAPAAMHIDPSDIRYVPYYRTLVDLNLPLLVRIGRDTPFGSADTTLGDPRLLALPLREGVTVIATHIAASEEYDGKTGYRRLLEMFGKYPNLFADTSGLSRFNKVGYLVDALKTAGLRDRLLYGSDWSTQFFPLTSPFYHWPDIDLAQAKSIQNIANAWDRDVALKLALGVPQAAFERPASMLGK